MFILHILHSALRICLVWFGQGAALHARSVMHGLHTGILVRESGSQACSGHFHALPASRPWSRVSQVLVFGTPAACNAVQCASSACCTQELPWAPSQRRATDNTKTLVLGSCGIAAMPRGRAPVGGFCNNHADKSGAQPATRQLTAALGPHPLSGLQVER